MATYEVTGYIHIPVTCEVSAENVEDALALGRELINDGIGVQHDQYLSDDYYLTTEEGVPVAQWNDGELIVEGQV